MIMFDRENADPTRILSAKEMQEVDRITIDEMQIPGEVLMDQAGRRAAEFLLEYYELDTSMRVFIACGIGNNGGDGMVVARYLNLAGVDVTVGVLGDVKKIKNEALFAWKSIEKLNFPKLEGIPSESELSQFDLIVDALLGIGFKGALRDPIKSAIEDLNQTRIPISSLDVPSGLACDSCQIPKTAIYADSTITFGWLKPSLLLQPSATLAGKIYVADIGFPEESLQEVKTSRHLISDSLFGHGLLARESNTHKGNYGHCLIIGGSEGMYGAPILSATAALKSGAGLVTLVTPENHSGLNLICPSEIMIRTTESGKNHFIPNDFEMIQNLISERAVDSVVLGMGMSQNAESQTLAKQLIETIDLPIVIDADGLAVFSDHQVKIKSQHVVVTPHPKECEKAFGLTIDAYQKEPFKQTEAIAIAHQCTLVYKTATTIISDVDGRSFVNSSGNPGMATAGMGDVLSGMIGSLLGQGLAIQHAVPLAVYLHGLAADEALSDTSFQGIVATSVIDQIAKAMKVFN